MTVTAYIGRIREFWTAAIAVVAAVTAAAAAASSRSVDALGSWRWEERRWERPQSRPLWASEVPSCWSSALTSVRRSTQGRRLRRPREGLSIGASVVQNARQRQTLRLTT